MRTPGMLYQERGADSISNLYNIKLVNKTVTAIPLSLKLESMPGQLQIIGNHAIDVKAEGQGSGSFFVILPSKLLTNRKTEIRIGLYDGNKKVDELKTNFLGPVK
jgi:IG-like fold at C-terminal of FixG, putative oxidoreductase